MTLPETLVALAERYAIRLLSSDGMYPSDPIVIGDFAALAAEDFAWSAVHSPIGEDLYPEGAVAWLTPEEVRFFSAISLAEVHPWTHGRPWIYSKCGPEFIDVERPHETDLLDLSRQVAARMRESEGDFWSSIPDSRNRPETLKRDYGDQATSLVEAIQDDRLLLRGLYKFLMASELRRYPHFLEESGLSAFISREAALEAIRRKLSRVTGQRVSKADVLDHLGRDIGEPFVELLESDWEARILMVHPLSKFGEFWSPPVHAEECYDALDTLVILYRYLLLDEGWIPEEF